jgi:hypothetical protein
MKEDYAMRKILVTVMLSVFPFVCFAQEPSAQSSASNSTVPVQVQTKTFIGKVDLISDWNARTKSKIVVRDDKGIDSTIMVTADTTIIGRDGNPTTLAWTKDNKVAIEYTVDQESVKTAKSIKVLAD